MAERKRSGVCLFLVLRSQNLDIAIATSDGIKWYTPYFFDKNMLDSILEESSDQHFRSLIQTRHLQRRRDVIDDNLAAEVVEEMGDNVWEPPEVQEALEEIGHPGIPLSVISKAAEIQLLYAVDNVLLGNRWLRKAAGIQPKFPYSVDSFEERSAASLRRACKSFNLVADSESDGCQKHQFLGMSENDTTHYDKGQGLDIRLPFGDWLGHLWPKQQQKAQSLAEKRAAGPKEYRREQLQPSPFLPKITMVGVSTGDSGQMNKATLKKTMDELTKELEHIDQKNIAGETSEEPASEDRDPLFVANVGDYYSSIAKTGSARWVRGRTN